MSDSLQPCGLKPARLLRPWDFQGKNTGVGCHFLLQGIFPSQGLNLWLLGLLHRRRILYHWVNEEAHIQLLTDYSENYSCSLSPIVRTFSREKTREFFDIIENCCVSTSQKGRCAIFVSYLLTVRFSCVHSQHQSNGNNSTKKYNNRNLKTHWMSSIIERILQRTESSVLEVNRI